ncbi:FAD-dependent oxidoreductase [Litorivicinus lipolyticus]|uniref:FAD-dependent oxidoreductase n=1 Tax=Litorivicinus lipolyticus TaxID=418701 RepID=A0A5Q2QDJ0_9GAMM|nr:FAD-dependent oxidoreductase [Litorivicinus lipolyticus]
MTAIPNLIIGGGVAALWLNAQAHARGHSTLAVSPSLGAGQTLLSQGIIHGGTKYALSGALTQASEAIKGMPARWLAALAGDGGVDLSGARIACDHQLMIHDSSLGGRLVQFFASKALAGRMESVAPPSFLSPDRRVYQLSEPVVDTDSVVQCLAAAAPVWAATVNQIDIKTGVVSLDDGRTVTAERIFLLAGAGNELVLNNSRLAMPAMQRRPLQMLVGRGALPPMWAHIVGTDTKPLATITTHNGFWYIGGDIAERGATQSESEFLTTAPARLAQLLPDIDLSAVEWSCVRVDRAEPATQNKARPDHPYWHQQGRLFTGWPTKLALAPALADALIPHFSPNHADIATESVPLATTPWNQS